MQKFSTMGLFVLLALGFQTIATADETSKGKRARDYGWAPGYMMPGTNNAITDVAGVTVGHITLHNDAKGQHTGVTAIIPHQGNVYADKVPAGYFQGNGFGKMMGTTQVIELGEVETPIMLTNTLNVADAAKGAINWTLTQKGNEEVRSVNAIVGETNDARVNDIRARFITMEIAQNAIEAAKSGAVPEGALGAGSGTVAFGYKAGIGTSSRVLDEKFGGHTVGVLVQANYGGDLHIMGQPVGRQLKDIEAQKTGPDGSVMVIIATDAPLSDRNLARLAKRGSLGIARTGGIMSNGSGDYFLAFSTNKEVRRTPERRNTPTTIAELPNNLMTPLFAAVIEATEEAVYNALVAAVDIKGYNGKVTKALPVDEVQKLLGNKP